MRKTHGLQAFLAALFLSVGAADLASAQDAQDAAQATQGDVVAPQSQDSSKPGWLLRGRAQTQKGIANPFRSTPAPGTRRALQNRAPTPKLPSAEGPAQPGLATPTTAGSPASPASCLIGFRRQGAECVAIEIPEHGTLDLTGHGWMCERGFRRDGQSCVALAVPENAALNDAGNSWVCNYGFRRQVQSCVAVVVPEHASLDKTGHTWACNQGYTQRGAICIDDATARLQQQADQAVKARPGTAPAAPKPAVTINSGENRQGRTSKAKVVIGRF